MCNSKFFDSGLNKYQIVRLPHNAGLNWYIMPYEVCKARYIWFFYHCCILGLQRSQIISYSKLWTSWQILLQSFSITCLTNYCQSYNIINVNYDCNKTKHKATQMNFLKSNNMNLLKVADCRAVSCSWYFVF